MNTQEVRAPCRHRERRTDPSTCVKCGFPIPPWYLTEQRARDFYEAVGLRDLADHGLERLGGPAAAEYQWLQYLERDNIPEGIDEGVDWAHYAFFTFLQTYLREARGELDGATAERVRARMIRAAKIVASGIREFQAAEADARA